MKQSANISFEGWMPILMFPPESFETYDVTLTDGSVVRAFWSGKAWWYQGKAIAPVSWRLLAMAVA